MVRLFLLLLSLLLPITASASGPSAQEQWKAFLTKPSAGTYEPLSRTIRMCVATKCQEAGAAGREDNFRDFDALLDLVERGNHYAMEIGFQIRPLYENAAAPGEYLDRSQGLSATLEPTFFLELIRKYNIPTGVLETLVVQTSTGSIDNLREQREELKRRIQSFSKVNDPRLLQIRDKAISLIQHEIDEDSAIPDGGGGK
jgi:hypothetical protein